MNRDRNRQFAGSAARRAAAAVVGASLGVLMAAGCLFERAGRPMPAGADARQRMRAERALAGTLFQIDIVAGDAARAQAAVEAAFRTAEREAAVLSEYRETSEVSAVNRAAGIAAVEVSPETIAVVARARHFSELTGGAFDITCAACARLWSVRAQRIPGDESVAACLEHVGYRDLVTDPGRSTVFLRRRGMRIGLGGIAKGYLVDRAFEVLRDMGMTDFVVNGGGDLRLLGRNGGRPWEVGIAHPRDPGALVGRLHLEKGAVATSGDYFRFFERDGVRYHHILDPATGMPARRSVAVTVIADNAMDADALATGLFVMGPEKGLELVERLPGIAALIIGPDLRPHASRHFPVHFARHAPISSIGADGPAGRSAGSGGRRQAGIHE